MAAGDPTEDPKRGSWIALAWQGLSWFLGLLMDQFRQKEQAKEDLKETLDYENKKLSNDEASRKRLANIDAMPLDADAINRLHGLLPSKPSQSPASGSPGDGKVADPKLPN